MIDIVMIVVLSLFWAVAGIAVLAGIFEAIFYVCGAGFVVWELIISAIGWVRGS
jgi:hypothetical protein